MFHIMQHEFPTMYDTYNQIMRMRFPNKFDETPGSAIDKAYYWCHQCLDDIPPYTNKVDSATVSSMTACAFLEIAKLIVTEQDFPRPNVIELADQLRHCDASEFHGAVPDAIIPAAFKLYYIIMNTDQVTVAKVFTTECFEVVNAFIAIVDTLSS